MPKLKPFCIAYFVSAQFSGLLSVALVSRELSSPYLKGDLLSRQLLRSHSRVFLFPYARASSLFLVAVIRVCPARAKEMIQ